MTISELQSNLDTLNKKITQSWAFLHLDEKIEELVALQKSMEAPDFWNDQDKAKSAGKRCSELEKELAEWTHLRTGVKGLLEMVQLDAQDSTVDLREEAEKEYEKYAEDFQKLEFFLLFSEKYDSRDAIVAIHAGTGGTDAMDWAEILLRMYMRFCENKNFDVEIVEQSFGGEAGIKSALLIVKGAYAFGTLKSEHGVHRLVRISPFDAEAMRHTSFALVEVVPELSDDDIKVEIRDEDLRIDTYRSGGKGGQNVNKIESAVRITHLPSKIVVACQNQRSQAQNKEQAMKILKAKLAQQEIDKQDVERKKLRGEYTEAVWGNQIRSYVLQPYQLIKDHRNEYEETDTTAVLDGKIDGFVEAYLKWKKR